MPVLSTIYFTVKYDLTGAPVIVLTDDNVLDSGEKGVFDILMPDGYNRVGDFNTPDVTAAGGSYSIACRFDNEGNVLTGEYVISYRVLNVADEETVYTKTFQFMYKPVSLVMREDFDVFTPMLKYHDDTSYQVPNYDHEPDFIVREWTSISTPTGTKTGSAIDFDLIHSGHYYDANYAITLEATIDYSHQVYTWLTVSEVISKTVSTFAETPKPLLEIIELVSSLKTKVDSLEDTVKEFYDVKENFQYCQSLFVHILDRLKVGSTVNIFFDLKSLMTALREYHIPDYIPANAIIYPYDLSAYFPGAVWGNITGSILSQYDLVSYVASQIASGRYAANIGDGSATSFNVSHGLNTKDVDIEVVKNSTGETVYTDTLRTSSGVVNVSFKNAPTTNQYRVIIKR